MPYEPILHVVLYQPEIHYNAGNVGRTCVAAGAKLWMVRPLGFRLTDRHLRRAGLDYWEHLIWQVVADWNELIQYLPPERMWFFSKWGQIVYTDVSYRVGDILVFGSETQGLPQWIRERYRDRLLRIPLRPEARSLNLAVSVGIAVFEALRQLGPQAGTLAVLPDGFGQPAGYSV
ncbi:MAG: tRNA (cytidine(34)-2'-O)-methyltransferase [Thermoguttaceae bacterium]|nr:tRNA (cytidine(34)-2'-O)-methyltransferase [Thermoguttaceae bacterium]MDW8078485.1 tRNA (cytidine(34)-2'-O)-methyltransferase [Thermoguttaceae bacterium]